MKLAGLLFVASVAFAIATPSYAEDDYARLAPKVDRYVDEASAAFVLKAGCMQYDPAYDLAGTKERLAKVVDKDLLLRAELQYLPAFNRHASLLGTCDPKFLEIVKANADDVMKELMHDKIMSMPR